MDSTGSKEIPEDINIWIEERIKDWSFETNKNIGRLIATDLYRLLRSENERLKGERDEYRILLEELSESARASDMPSVANGIDVILDKYPNPTT